MVSFECSLLTIHVISLRCNSHTMPNSIPCDHCRNDIPQPAERCPHCARPGIFWNVIVANHVDERTELDRRYDAAKADAIYRGTEISLQSFENALAASKAVIARNEHEVLRLATSTRQLYATYYQQMEAGLRLPDGDDWDVVREIADTLIFPKYKRDMRFGALSLNGTGLVNYGSCSIALREDMISHRASVFEENSLLFMKRKNIQASNPDLPKGFRAGWDRRNRLCVAKLAGNIDSTSDPNKYSEVLLRCGASSADDAFVEVHIWGPISVLSMEKVTITDPNLDVRATIRKAVAWKLAQHGVPLS